MESVIQYNEHNGHNGLYVEATRAGYEFANTESRQQQLEQKREKERESVKDRPAYTHFLSWICLFVAIGFGIIEMQNIFQAITAQLGVGTVIGLIISLCFTFLAVVLGEQLRQNLIRDPFTGKKRPNGKFYFVLLVVILYLATIAFLAFSAGHGSSDLSVQFMMAFSVITSTIEIAFGFLFMRDLLVTMTLFLLGIRIKNVRNKLSKLSKRTEHIWQRYLYAVQQAGEQAQPETEAVSRARAYYANGGYSDDHLNSSSDN